MCGVSLWNEAGSSYGFELTVIPVRMGWAGKELRNEEKKKKDKNFAIYKQFL